MQPLEKQWTQQLEEVQLHHHFLLMQASHCVGMECLVFQQEHLVDLQRA